jgi:23S rRNA (uridine2479-2'-O)-methyltransferase
MCGVAAIAERSTVTVRNARFQQWQALLTNRTKRNRTGSFLVQGVRPLTRAMDHGWPLRTHVSRRVTDPWTTHAASAAPSVPDAFSMTSGAPN